MFKSYLKIAWRNFMKDKQFTLLNLIGLSTGLACVLLIYMWASDELRIDKFHQKDEQLFQVLGNQKNLNNIATIQETPAMLARTLKKEMPEVEYAIGVLPTSWFGRVTLSQEDNNVKAMGHYSDKDFFNVFSYRLLQGDKDRVLEDRSSIVLSESLARKLFHTTDNVIGKRVQWQHDQQYVVSGVFADPPLNSSDQFDFVLPLDIFIDRFPWQKNWDNGDPATYVVLKKGTDAAQFNQKIAGFIKGKLPDTNEQLFARPYSSGYLYGKYVNGYQVGGRIEYVRLFIIIAIFILVISCINFMNLSTAKASKRMKEVGIKKAVGASRMSLVLQHLGESMLMTMLSLVLAVVFVAVLLPKFNDITGKTLSLSISPGFILSVLGIAVFTGVLAGSYPAFYLSSFKPVEVLKGKLRNTVGEFWVRRGLVVFQFALSVIFIVSVIVIYKQIIFIQNGDMGYNRANIISMDMTGISKDNADVMLAEARRIPGVINASGMDHSSLVGDFGTSTPYWEGKNPKDVLQFGNIGVNYGMIETLGLQVVQGRTFDRGVSSDSNEVILNKVAVDAMGIKDPIGKKITLWEQDGHRTIVGVVKDFHVESLHENVKPFALRLVSQYTAQMMVKVQPGAEQQVIAKLEGLNKTFHPGFPFEFKFLDNDFQAQYVAENRVAILSRYLGGLAILISCLGLFGLAAFTAERRFKEIGIRKVLGASVGSVVVLLSRDFLRLICIAILVAFPIAWWATREWLQGFAYRVSIGAMVFFLAAAFTIMITLLTVSYQAIRAALVNPVKGLRSE